MLKKMNKNIYFKTDLDTYLNYCFKNLYINYYYNLVNNLRSQFVIKIYFHI